MNKKLLIGGIVVLVLLVVGGLWYTTSRSTSTTMPATDVEPTVSSQEMVPTTDPVATTSGSFSGSLADLITRGGAYTCTWTYDVDGKEQKGTVYIANDKMAGQIDINSGTGMITMNMVGDKETMKGWMTIPKINQKIGFQFDMKKAVSKADGIAGMDPNAAAQFKEKYNYQCAPWTPDPSKFVVPSDVKFMQAPQ